MEVPSGAGDRNTRSRVTLGLAAAPTPIDTEATWTFKLTR